MILSCEKTAYYLPPIIFKYFPSCLSVLLSQYSLFQIKLGWKDDLFPKLSLLQSHLQEHLPLSSSPLQKLVTMKRAESFSSSSILSMAKPVKSQQKNGVAVIVERLPSFIVILSQLTELNLAYVPSTLLHNLSAQPSLLKEIPLQANLEKLLEKMPSVWKKVLRFDMQLNFKFGL